MRWDGKNERKGKERFRENKSGLETVALRKRRQAELEGAESKNVERHGQTLIDPGVTDGESRLRWFGGEEDAGQDEMEADDWLTHEDPKEKKKSSKNDSQKLHFSISDSFALFFVIRPNQIHCKLHRTPRCFHINSYFCIKAAIIKGQSV